jgi:hypothetical protein
MPIPEVLSNLDTCVVGLHPRTRVLISWVYRRQNSVYLAVMNPDSEAHVHTCPIEYHYDS